MKRKKGVKGVDEEEEDYKRYEFPTTIDGIPEDPEALKRLRERSPYYKKRG